MFMTPVALMRNNNPFKFQIKSDNSGVSTNNQFSIPTVEEDSYYDFYVKVPGDSYVSSRITSYDDADVVVPFDTAGVNNIEIHGTFKGWKFNNSGDKLKILNISQVGAFDHGNEDNTFYGCSNLTVTAIDKPLVKSGSTNIVGFFYDCTSITELPLLSSYDFTSVTDATNFLNGVTLNESQFNTLLSNLKISIDSLQNTVAIHFGNSTYSIGDPATTIYDLITDKSWTITTAGLKYGQPISYWLDASDTSTITETSGAVDSIADKSLNSVGLTATTTQRPTTNSRTQNGLNVLDFNGSSNYMTFSTNDLVDTPFTVFIVAQVDDTTQQNILGRQTGPVAGQWTLVKNGGFAIFQTYAFGALLPATGTVKTFNTNTNIHCTYLEDGSALQYQLNNDTPSSDTNTLSGYDNSVATALVLGASPGGGNYLDGAVCEIITFSGILSSSDRTEIATYLNNKWGVY